MSEPQNNKPSYNMRKGPAYEHGNANPRPGGGTAYYSWDTRRTPPGTCRTTDEIIIFYVSILQSITNYPALLDDTLLMEIQEQLEGAKSRLACIYDRSNNASPTMHAELKRQKLFIGADRSCVQMKKLVIEGGHNLDAEEDRLLNRVMHARMEIRALQTRLLLLELQGNN
ncbi:predicted protein [Sclerotinia sclerotiorum 1980 UF-70]|uniref:Uncharacterized protein n=1 Tax=Sclerotinia sclerotiorum (strain ATCC 18683 / 1980 / Ss-1) TaxID=665079 RepID=A7F9H4_SCLS1|nr:predicted protein [Sclerotinia sclerotiorum 1980 UF-70]EDO00385.1 predicted protein [Sclerotinia sclerotiorum 1980 UF-70]